jgi:hypothetical protein
LKVFKKLAVKIVPLFEDVEKLATRSKFKHLFDVGYIGFFHSAFINKEELKNIFKPEGI